MRLEDESSTVEKVDDKAGGQVENETGTLEQMEDETDPLPTIFGG